MVASPPLSGFGDLVNKPGLAGQGTSTPSEKVFGSHYVIHVLDSALLAAVSGGPYFDPSYGQIYTGPLNFESSAVDGYALRDEHSISIPGTPPARPFVARKAAGAANITLADGLDSTLTLVLPADHTTGLSGPPVFTWTPVSGATIYRLSLSSSNAFPAGISTVPITPYDPSASTFTWPTSLSPSSTYYWKVEASNCYFSGTWRTVSSARSFTTAP
jgi:hypothetical protein